VVTVELDDFEAFKYGEVNSLPLTGHTVLGVIARRSDEPQNQRARVRVKKSTGSWSEWYTTTIGVNGTDYVVLNDRHPEIIFSTIDYPFDQLALKEDETAKVNHTVQYHDDILYSSPISQLNITGDTTYDSEKVVERIDGEYNISSDNFIIVAIKTSNNATSTDSIVVQIADKDQEITVSTLNNRSLISGGYDDTSPQNHVITIGSTQKLLSVPTLEAPVGTWQNSGFVGNTAFTSFTRSLQIHDSMNKGTYSWGTLNTVNLAGKVVTTITTGDEYVLSGFVSRNIGLTAQLYETQMNVQATIYENVTFSWDFNPDIVVREDLNSFPVITNGWCLDTLGSHLTKIRVLDKNYQSATQETIITIEETAS